MSVANCNEQMLGRPGTGELHAEKILTRRAGQGISLRRPSYYNLPTEEPTPFSQASHAQRAQLMILFKLKERKELCHRYVLSAHPPIRLAAAVESRGNVMYMRTD